MNIFRLYKCKLLELDAEHDFLIDIADLAKYSNQAPSYSIFGGFFSQICC